MSNTSTATGTIVSVTEEAASSGYCLITGYLKDIMGNALKGYGFVVRYIHYPIAVSATTLHLKERMFVRAGSDGKVSFQLLQGAQVKIEIPGRVLDLVRSCTIPTASTADLIDILFPRVASAAFSTSTLTMSVGEEKSLTITGTFSDGTTDNISSSSTLSSSTANVSVVSGTTIKAISAGQAVITISSVDSSTLNVNKEPDGDAIVVTNVSAPTLTAELTVTVG